MRRANGLLTWRRARFWAFLLCALYLVAYVDVLVTGSPPLNSDGVPIGGDYIAFVAAGKLLVTGRAASLYDHQPIADVQNELLRGRLPGFYDAFRNPPFAALPFAPLALLDLLPGLMVWSLISIACLVLATWLVLQEVPQLKSRWRGLLLIVFAFAPVYFGIIDGENATVSLLLYVLIYRSMVNKHDGHAGVWAALGLFKPQLFLVFPLVFLAGRHWRALATYGATAAGLGLLSLGLVGAEGLQAWVRILVEPESGNAQVNAWRMASLKSMFDLLAPSTARLSLAAYVVSAAVLLAGLFAIWSPSHRRSSPRLRWAYTSLVAVLVDPHLVDYDLTVLIAAGVLAVAGTAVIGWSVALLYAVTLLRIQIPLGGGGLQVTAIVLCLLAGLTWWQLRADRPSHGRPLARRGLTLSRPRPVVGTTG